MLSKESQLTVGMAVSNLFNFQGVTASDDTYTRAAVLPIVNGTTKDLPVRNADRSYTCTPPACKLTYDDGTAFDGVDVNPNFGNPSSYQAPRSFRFTAKVSF